MQRIFTRESIRAGAEFSVTDAQAMHHLRSVMRLKQGDALEAVDAAGRVFCCRVIEVEPQEIRLRADQEVAAAGAQRIELSIACAIPKKAKIDDIINSLTQLGVARIIPMHTHRCIAKIPAQDQARRMSRWVKIAQSAAEQSKRQDIPEISSLMSFHEVINESAMYDCKLIPALFGERKSLSEILRNRKISRCLVMIGPEGDFTPAELSVALNAGFITVTLGNLVLRVDTAATAVAAFMHLLDENR